VDGRQPELDLRLLETFCRVVEERSFTRAALALHRSQASVSERIATLERDLGSRLLDRMGRETVPTAAGRALYSGARDLLARRAELGRELETLRGAGGGSVAIGASTIPGEYDLPRLMPRFLNEHPGTRFTLRIGDTREILSAMAAHDLDLGLVGYAGESEGLRLRPLWRDELILAVPATHGWAARRRIRVDRIAGERLLLREEGSGTQRFLEAALASVGIDPSDLDPVAELGSTTAIKQAVIAGLGISFLSRRAVESDRRAGLLATVAVAGVDLNRNIFLVDDPCRSLSDAAGKLSDFLLDSTRPRSRGR